MTPITTNQNLATIKGMKCINCSKEMKKVGWVITSNHKTGYELVEYDSTTYHCADDDIWVNVEIPLAKYAKKLED